jgi:elongation factor Ts
MEINAKQVKELRDKTGAGMMDCKKALTECNGDMEKATNYLREKGIAKAVSKGERETKEGRIYSYIHSNNKIGVLVEINCETDFVAKNEQFELLCKDIAMHIAATAPKALKPEDLDPAFIEGEKEILRNKAINEGKPADKLDKILEGQINKLYEENCLLQQKFVKDEKKSIQDIINESIATIGENIQIARFIRYQLGE